jgi:CHAT domain-containing protein
MSKSQIPDITRAVQNGVRWLKDYAEELTDARDIAICMSALVTAERNPHSHLIQRLASSLIRQQALNGSWNEELWDTVWATKALYDTGYEISSPEMHAALRFLEGTQDTLTGTWYEEPFETMLVLDLLVRIVPDKLLSLSERSLKWIASLQKPDGAIIGIRYTGMAASLFHLMQKVGFWNNQQVIELALQYIRNDLREKSIWTSAAWSNYYPLISLLDCGATLDDSFVSKAVNWFLASQDVDGKWVQVSRVHDTAMAVLVLSNLLTTPLIDISDPRTGILSVNRENGTIRVSFHGPGTGAITPAEKIKISSQVRADLSQNQQLMMDTMRPVRDKRSAVTRRNQQKQSMQAELKKSGRYAYGHLIPAKIQLLLETSLADHLRFDIDERLIDLPWELIHDGTEFICLRYAMGRRLVSDQNFLPSRRPPRFAKETRVMIVADPTNDLPAAKKEGHKVAQLLRDKCMMHVDEFTSSDITKKDFLLSLKDYDILHFAGHASHESRSPDESCLAFADGEIQAFEIARFITNRAPVVVFLNACWSAEELRNPDSYSPMMRGLGRTFLYAGVSAFIGYLVPVPDDSATQFAISFYESLAQGQTIGESLRRARIESHNLRIPGDLTYLSAVLYGDPAVRAIESTR